MWLAWQLAVLLQALAHLQNNHSGGCCKPQEILVRLSLWEDAASLEVGSEGSGAKSALAVCHHAQASEYMAGNAASLNEDLERAEGLQAR